MLQPATIPDLQAILRERHHIVPQAGSTKPALSQISSSAERLDLSHLKGVLEYNPGEYTFTALAATPLIEIQAMLAQNGQYLPFDPLFADRGSTLGGTVASGISGPGRYRYGGLRDFILGTQFVDGRGELIRGGGKVVKNSAGFDIPKLMVGSLGMFGIFAELTFKVFPAAPAHFTVTHPIAPLNAALEALNQLYIARMEIDSLDFAPVGDGLKFWVRLAGLPEGLPARAERLRRILGGGDILESASESATWEVIRSFNNLQPTAALVKVPLSPQHIPQLESHITTMQRHYSAAGNVVWLSANEMPPTLHDTLYSLNLSGLVVFGNTPTIRLGARTGQAFETRIKRVFDPLNLLPGY
jgi:glycolate oxidase FAD binding subunit